MVVYISYQPFVSFSVLEQAKTADDVDMVRLQNQIINNANQVWLSFAIRSSGSIIESAGTKGSLQIEAEYLTDLPAIVKQYELAIGQDLQVGIGMKLSESAQALAFLVKKGTLGMFIYDPEVIELETMEKASPGPAQNQGAHSGYDGHHTGHRPKPSTEDASEVTAISKEIEQAKTLTEKSPKSNPESAFHLKAQKQSKIDKVNNQKKAVSSDKIKQQLIQVLQQIQTQGNDLAVLKQQAPDVYQSIMALMNSVITLGREVFGKSPVLNKAEELNKGLSDIKSGAQVPISKQNDQWQGNDKPDSKSFDYTHTIPESAKARGYRIHVNHGGHGNLSYFTSRLFDKSGKNVGYVHAYGTKPGIIEPHSFIEKAHRGQGLGIAMYEALYALSRQNGIHTIKGNEHSEQAARVHEALSRKHGFNYKKISNPEYGNTSATENGPYKYTIKSELTDTDKNSIEEDLDKAAFGSTGGGGANPLGIARTHYKGAPPGTVDHLKFKVKRKDGSTSWLSQRSGSAQASEPDVPLLGQNSFPAAPNSKEVKER